MSDPQQVHPLLPSDSKRIEPNDMVFDCPACRKSLVVDQVAAGQILQCPICKKPIQVPMTSRVVTLAQAPETAKIAQMPDWEQELLSIQSALKETKHQREEAGNFYRQHSSEANRQQLRMEKLDAKLKELHARLEAIYAEHPEKKNP